MSELQFARFGVAIGFAGDHTVLGVRGGLDRCTAPTMASVLHAVIDQGHTDIVLDLSAAGSVTSAGLGMVASAAARLRRANGVLTVRSPSPGVRRIFDVTGLSEHVHLEEHESDTVALGPQRHSGELAALFATHASTAVAEARRGSLEQAALDRVTGGLQARELIAQAQGVLMAQKHLTADEAAGALYRSARAARVPLLRLAGDIVAGTCSDER